MTKTMHFIALFLLVLVAGVFWGTWFTLTRSIESFSAAEFIHIGKVIIANVAAPMRAIMPSCIAAIILSLWLYEDKKQTGFYFLIMSLALILVTLLITLLILVPIDNSLKEWTASNVPGNWEAIRDRWSAYHAARTLTSLAAFMCYSVAILITKPPREIRL